MLSGLWIYALYSTLKVDLTASLLDLYLVFFSMRNCEDKILKNKSMSSGDVPICFHLLRACKYPVWQLTIASSNTVQWLGPKGDWWSRSEARPLQLHPFIGQRRSISNKPSPWLRGMELAGGAFWRWWHSLPPYQTAERTGQVHTIELSRMSPEVNAITSSINNYYVHCSSSLGLHCSSM